MYMPIGLKEGKESRKALHLQIKEKQERARRTLGMYPSPPAGSPRGMSKK
jgi:hypothetical protein